LIFKTDKYNDPHIKVFLSGNVYDFNELELTLSKLDNLNPNTLYLYEKYGKVFELREKEMNKIDNGFKVVYYRKHFYMLYSIQKESD